MLIESSGDSIAWVAASAAASPSRTPSASHSRTRPAPRSPPWRSVAALPLSRSRQPAARARARRPRRAAASMSTGARSGDRPAPLGHRSERPSGRSCPRWCHLAANLRYSRRIRRERGHRGHDEPPLGIRSWLVTPSNSCSMAERSHQRLDHDQSGSAVSLPRRQHSLRRQLAMRTANHSSFSLRRSPPAGKLRLRDPAIVLDAKRIKLIGVTVYHPPEAYLSRMSAAPRWSQKIQSLGLTKFLRLATNRTRTAVVLGWILLDTIRRSLSELRHLSELEDHVPRLIRFLTFPVFWGLIQTAPNGRVSSFEWFQ